MYTEQRPEYFQQLQLTEKGEANGNKSIIRSIVTFIVLKTILRLTALRMTRWPEHVAHMSVIKSAHTYM